MNKQTIFCLLAFIVCLTACEKKDLSPDAQRAFSVSAHDKVLFAPGNLQFSPAYNQWRFASSQYDIVGEDNKLISSETRVYLDLFAWGATGAYGIQPWDIMSEYEHYIPTIVDIAGTQRDWGVASFVRAQLGGEEWYTLSRAEWDYLLTGRPNAAQLYSRACVAETNGLLLLPDKWQLPENSHFTPRTATYAANMYSDAEWKTLKDEGAVFLPAAGYRSGTSNWTEGGYYWTSTVEPNGNGAYQLQITQEVVRTIEADPSIGRAVRLARKIK